MFFHRHSRRFLHSRKTEKVLCQFLSQLCFIQLYSEATPSLEKWHSVPDCWSARRLQVRNKKHLLKSCPHGHYAPHCKNWPDTSYNTYLSIFSHPAHVRLQEIQSKESTKFKNKEAQVYSLCLFLQAVISFLPMFPLTRWRAISKTYLSSIFRLPFSRTGELKDKEMGWKDQLIGEFGSINWVCVIHPIPFPFFSGTQTLSP